jgi:hypothetical protein
MKLILIATMIFVLYELVKLIMFNKFWEFTFESPKNKYIVSMEILYMIYSIYLLFTEYWYIGLGIWIVSILTSFQIAKAIKKHMVSDKTSKFCMILDHIISFTLLSFIVVNELILKI